MPLKYAQILGETFMSDGYAFSRLATRVRFGPFTNGVGWRYGGEDEVRAKLVEEGYTLVEEFHPSWRAEAIQDMLAGA